MKKINVVLCTPEIPGNTGNISRTCAVTGAALHIIRPIGFDVSDAALRRAGLDYWDKLSVFYYDSLADFYEKNPGAEIYYFSSKAARCYADVPYPDNVFLMFGCETKGLPEEVLLTHADRCLRIPMLPALRCLNLSNAVAVAVYEVLRADGFCGFSKAGKFGGEV